MSLGYDVAADAIANDNVSPAQVQAVYEAVREAIDGTGFCKSTDLVDDVEAGPSQIGAALRVMSEDDDCPLDVEQWSRKCRNPITWHVTVPAPIATDGGER